LRKSARFEVFCAYLAFFVWSGHALKKKKKKKKSHHPYISPHRRGATADPKWTKLGSIGEWPNVITPTNFKVHCLKAVGMAGGSR
jgi:hypothetical protein